MPQIKQYFSQERAAVGGGVRASGEQFGAGIGRATQDFGGAISEFGKDVEEVVQRKQERDATAFISREYTGLQLESQQKLESLKTEVEDIDSYTDQFNEWYGQRYNEILERSPNNLAKQNFEARNVELSQKLNQSALAYQSGQKIQIQKGDSLSAVDNLSNSISLNPNNFDDFLNQSTSIVEGAKRYMTPAEHQKFQRDASSQLYSSRIKAEIASNPYSAKDLLTDENVKNNINSTTYQRLQTQAENEINRLEKEQLKQSNEMLKARLNDTGKLAILSGAETPEEMVAVQRNLGITEGNISVLPNQVAALEANTVNGFQNADEYIQFMQQRSTEYRGESFNTYLKDLKDNGMTQEVSYLAMMDFERDKPVMDAMFAMSRDDANYKTIAKAQGVIVNDVKADIETEIAETRDMFISEGADITGLNDKLTDIAIYFQARGQSRDAAVKLATSWINDKIQVTDYSSSELGLFDSKKVRVPQEYDVEVIGKSLTRALNAITKEDVNITGAGEFSTNELKRTSSFVLSPDNNYYYMRDQFGSPILKKDSSDILKFPIKELLEDNKEAIKEIERKRFEEALKGFEEE